jgi:hypothetical protein
MPDSIPSRIPSIVASWAHVRDGHRARPDDLEVDARLDPVEDPVDRRLLGEVVQPLEEREQFVLARHVLLVGLLDDLAALEQEQRGLSLGLRDPARRERGHGPESHLFLFGLERLPERGHEARVLHRRRLLQGRHPALERLVVLQALDQPDDRVDRLPRGRSVGLRRVVRAARGRERDGDDGREDGQGGKRRAHGESSRGVPPWYPRSAPKVRRSVRRESAAWAPPPPPGRPTRAASARVGPPSIYASDLAARARSTTRKIPKPNAPRSPRNRSVRFHHDVSTGVASNESADPARAPTNQ